MSKKYTISLQNLLIYSPDTNNSISSMLNTLISTIKSSPILSNKNFKNIYKLETTEKKNILEKPVSNTLTKWQIFAAKKQIKSSKKNKRDKASKLIYDEEAHVFVRKAKYYKPK
ncbi:hypothetical protein CDIK_0541 [Cucumispora dikerogammari]|nr:hypothetical protein CDIK_0541 [Cucumispora dikerogammari]